tara:strand:- start:21 stop:143 length:123 start_codon:yes stop_codon:yes gene_type:complete
MLDIIYSFQPFFFVIGMMAGFAVIELTEASIFQPVVEVYE